MAASCVGPSLRREPRLAAPSGGTDPAGSPNPEILTPRHPHRPRCPRSAWRGSSRRPRRREGMGGEGEGSAPGNCGGRVRRADYLYSLPVFMGCPVRHRTRSRCVGAVQDYLWGRAAPGGCLLSAFLHLPVNCQFIALQRGAGGGKALD